MPRYKRHYPSLRRLGHDPEQQLNSNDIGVTDSDFYKCLKLRRQGCVFTHVTERVKKQGGRNRKAERNDKADLSSHLIRVLRNITQIPP